MGGPDDRGHVSLRDRRLYRRPGRAIRRTGGNAAGLLGAEPDDHLGDAVHG
jgi:hypothetical protein